MVEAEEEEEEEEEVLEPLVKLPGKRTKIRSQGSDVTRNRNARVGYIGTPKVNYLCGENVKNISLNYAGTGDVLVPSGIEIGKASPSMRCSNMSRAASTTMYCPESVQATHARTHTHTHTHN